MDLMLVFCFLCFFMEICSNVVIRQGIVYNLFILIKDLLYLKFMRNVIGFFSVFN